jgi:recombinational DNA repair protein RecR
VVKFLLLAQRVLTRKKRKMRYCEECETEMVDVDECLYCIQDNREQHLEDAMLEQVRGLR